MNRLLSANFLRIKLNIFFWGFVILTIMYALFSIAVPIINIETIEKVGKSFDDIYFNFVPAISFFIAMFVSLFVGTDYSDGAIRNKVIAGTTRTSIYLSNVVTTFIVFTALVLMLLTLSLIGIPFLGTFEMDIFHVALYIVIILFVTMVFSAIFAFIAMMCPNKAITVVISIVVLLGLIIFSAQIDNTLKQPEFLSDIYIVDGSLVQENETPNPKYITGNLRSVYEYILDLSPTGQSFKIAWLEIVAWILCSILTMIIILMTIKIRVMKKSINEIRTELCDRLSTDTNTAIFISSRDKNIQDLTSELNTQLRLLRKQRLQYLTGDKELKDAVTNISHDLRTPLTAICGYLDLLEDEEKTEDVARYIAFIADRTNTLKQLTEELFRYSVIMSTTDNMKLELVSVNKVLEECIASFYTALTYRNITPTITIPNKDDCCMLNRASLSRVFSDIITNALKYSDGDLDIKLTDNNEIVFTNTATTLNEIEVGKLFNRFFTVDKTRKGTGLGLAISKALVEQMNGEISAQYKDKKLSIYIQFNTIK